MTDPRHLWRTMLCYMCSCCGEPICLDKSPGIGYYCGDCLDHFGESQDCGRPGARFAEYAEYHAWVDADHERMLRRGQGYPHARSIPDVKFLAAVHVAQLAWTATGGGPFGGRLYPATRRLVQAALCGYDVRTYGRDDAFWPTLTADDERLVPWRVVIAKFRRLYGRDLVDGCTCECRGDYELTEKGRAVLAQAGDDLTSGASRMSEILEAPSATQSAEPAPVKVPGPVNCTTDDPTWNVSHLVVSNLLDGSGLTICGQTLAVADHPDKHVDCTCNPEWPRCERCVEAKVEADARKARMHA